MPTTPGDTPAPPPFFRVVLHEPEIPNNTGNIGRTCVATGCDLALIRPIAFDTSEKACRRAGLDYWPRLRVREFDRWDDYADHANALDPRPTVWALTTKSARTVFTAPFGRGDVLLFGKETAGLPAALLDRYAACTLRLPMAPGERSLNLATAVCAVVYQGLRHLVATDQARLSPSGDLVIDR